MSEGRRHRDVVMPVRVDPTGLAGPTPGQARGWRWRRVSKGLYVPADVDPTTTAQRIVEAVAGTGGAVTGWAAVHWMGATWFDGVASGGPLPVPIALGDRRQVRPRPGVSVSEDWLFHDDVFVVDELPVTVPERSVTFQVRRTRSLARAVQIIDMAAFADLVDIVASQPTPTGSWPAVGCACSTCQGGTFSLQTCSTQSGVSPVSTTARATTEWLLGAATSIAKSCIASTGSKRCG
jgi:hypothetical protein